MSKSSWNRVSALAWALVAATGCGSGGGGSPADGAGDGRERIAATRDLSVALGPVGPQGAASTVTGTGDAGGTYTCTTEGWGESEVRDLTDTIALDPG